MEALPGKVDSSLFKLLSTRVGWGGGGGGGGRGRNVWLNFHIGIYREKCFKIFLSEINWAEKLKLA